MSRHVFSSHTVFHPTQSRERDGVAAGQHQTGIHTTAVYVWCTNQLTSHHAGVFAHATTQPSCSPAPKELKSVHVC